MKKWIRSLLPSLLVLAMAFPISAVADERDDADDKHYDHVDESFQAYLDYLLDLIDGIEDIADVRSGEEVKDEDGYEEMDKDDVEYRERLYQWIKENETSGKDK